MFGPGFVWLVRTVEYDTWSNRKNVLKILLTYLAGTPYAGAHYRQQSVDMNTETALRAATRQGLSGMEFARQHTVQNTAGSFGKSSSNARVSKGGVEVTPVLCVNTWEHAYLRHFGVKGKRFYLEKFWDNVDWHVVHNRCDF